MRACVCYRVQILMSEFSASYRHAIGRSPFSNCTYLIQNVVGLHLVKSFGISTGGLGHMSIIDLLLIVETLYFSSEVSGLYFSMHARELVRGSALE